jgi:nitroreductase
MEAGNPDNPDYAYYPKEWFEPYSLRGKACGLALYAALKIEKDDLKRRKEQWYYNFHFFGAPVGFIFLIDHRLGMGSWLDMGLFLENVMLAARGLGLESCPQASFAERPNIVRYICDIYARWHVVFWMAIGYADWSNPISQYRTAREPLEHVVE